MSTPKPPGEVVDIMSAFLKSKKRLTFKDLSLTSQLDTISALFRDLCAMHAHHGKVDPATMVQLWEDRCHGGISETHSDLVLLRHRMTNAASALETLGVPEWPTDDRDGWHSIRFAVDVDNPQASEIANNMLTFQGITNAALPREMVNGRACLVLETWINTAEQIVWHTEMWDQDEIHFEIDFEGTCNAIRRGRPENGDDTLMIYFDPEGKVSFFSSKSELPAVSRFTPAPAPLTRRRALYSPSKQTPP